MNPGFGGPPVGSRGRWHPFQSLGPQTWGSARRGPSGVRQGKVCVGNKRQMPAAFVAGGRGRGFLQRGRCSLLPGPSQRRKPHVLFGGCGKPAARKRCPRKSEPPNSVSPFRAVAGACWGDTGAVQPGHCGIMCHSNAQLPDSTHVYHCEFPLCRLSPMATHTVPE